MTEVESNPLAYPIIHYQASELKDNQQIAPMFYVDVQPESAAWHIVATAMQATSGALLGNLRNGRMFLALNYHTVLALLATGFEWDLSAAMVALRLLGRIIEKATFVGMFEESET